MQPNWFQTQRLKFIEQCLIKNGRINANDIVKFFDISRGQASRDIQLYIKNNGKGIFYNFSQKCYLTSDLFKPVFTDKEREVFEQ